MSDYNINDSRQSEIEELQKRLTEIIDSDNNKKLQIKDLEIKNSELSKKNFEFQSHLQNLIIKMNLITQENSTLKLEIKKLQLSINSPGKIIASLGTTNKTNITTDNLLKEKSELKETNDKLILVLSERETELSNQKIDYENKINDLNTIITEQKAKINDLNNDMKDIQEQFNTKDKEIQKLEEEKISGINYNKLKVEYDLLKVNFEKMNQLYEDLQAKYNVHENENKNLNERVIKIEKAFSNLVKSGDQKVKDVNDLEIYNEINENLRTQITELQDGRDKMEKKNNETCLKHKQDYKNLEDKYLEFYEKNSELEQKIEDSQNTFINDTMKLNTEITNLNDKIREIEKERDSYKNKNENLLKELDNNSKNFQNLQNIMTKLREKDDIDITLIEERYIVLENVLELEKNEIVNTNRELINKVKILTQKNQLSSIGEGNMSSNMTEYKEDMDNNLKLEIKNLSEENKLLQIKIKEQDKRLIQLQKKTDVLNIVKEENQTLKKNLNENNTNLQVIIKELTDKTNQLNEELLQSRKRTSLLRSKPNFRNEELKTKIDQQNMNKEIEKYQKEIELLKNENLTQQKKSKEEVDQLEAQISSLKAEIANAVFEKEDEVFKYKTLAKKYKDMLEANGILKKKQ